jgi:LPS-assembly protein
VNRLLRTARRLVAAFVGASLAFVARPATGQLLEGFQGAEEITIDAESVSYDNRANTVAAEGQVVIHYGDSILRADRVDLDRKTKEASAQGSVSLTSPEGTIEADQLLLNLDDETGVLENAEIHSTEQGYSLRGDHVEKGLGQTYHIVNGKFTTCRCAEGAPSWSIAGDLLDVALDGYGTLDGATFNVLDKPVLYIPKAAFPVHRERQSGLLFPRVGFSNRRGLQIVQPLYWAINKSQDATFGLDVETAARIGLLGEYRYALSQTFHGAINASYFNEAIRGSANESSTGLSNQPSVPENRWGVLSQHEQKIGPATGYADLQLVGDDLFFREINTFTIDHRRDVALRTLPFTTSRAGFVQGWSRVTLQGEGIYYQDLIGDDSLTLQRAPELRLNAQKRLWPDLLLGEAGVSVTNFQRDDGITGARADIRPSALLRLPLGRSLFGSVRAALRETAYALSQDKMSGGFRGDDPSAPEIELPSTSTRETLEVGADMNTALSRVYGFRHYGFDKLKHTIEPRLEYLFVPNVSQSDLPVFDGIDRISHRSLMTYGVVNRLLARRAQGDEKPEGDVRELGELSVSQSYDFQRRIPDDFRSSNDHFSDVDFDLRISPLRDAWIRFFSTFDATTADFTSTTVAIRLVEPRLHTKDTGGTRLRTRPSLRVAYRFLVDNEHDLAQEGQSPSRLPDLGAALTASQDGTVPPPSSGTETRQFRDIQQLESSIVIPLLDRVGFMYAMRYDILSGRFFENHFGLRLLSACDCWSLDIGFTDKSNPNELELLAQLRLVGLGSFGTGSRFGSSE